MKVKNYLRLNQLNVFYGSSQILFNLSFDAIRGKTLALLGRNGAGKSTTLKSLIGLVPISSGSYILNNKHLETLKSFEIAKLGVGYVPEDRQVFKLHTVEENLLIGAKENSKQKQTFHLKEIYNFFPLLNELKNRDAGLLSGGEQQMLSIARTLMGNPDVLLLDEPSEGLAPIIVQDIAKLIKNLQNTEVTIIIAEQNIRFCFAIADNAAIIDKGTIVYENTISELKKDTKTLKKYLAV
jgi:branched-chain amino acid transport system ATP-binding protein|tara:strand:+ start:4009 stop:4725 length:717 start_codon:yes stop_codon:yes gene_type:complete